jgi:hypothetical protein
MAGARALGPARSFNNKGQLTNIGGRNCLLRVRDLCFAGIKQRIDKYLALTAHGGHLSTGDPDVFLLGGHMDKIARVQLHVFFSLLPRCVTSEGTHVPSGGAGSMRTSPVC